MNDVETTTGGCLCGAVRYEVRGAPFWVGHCHCLSCRRHTGAPMVTFAGFKKHQVAFTRGERRIYASSPDVERAFCGQCGTPLTWEGNSNLPGRGAVIEFHISTLDDPNGFVPTNDVWFTHRIPWFDVSDTLPRFHQLDFNSAMYCQGPASKSPHRAEFERQET